jgi:hypothetical protein
LEHASKRRHERFTFNTPLEVRLPGQIEWLKARACDVSVGGLSFETETRLEVGDEIRIGLLNPNGIAFVLHAIVRYVRAEAGQFVVGTERRAY